MLKNYKGDFTDFDTRKAEEFIKDVFSKVLPGRVLIYNNTDDINADNLIFATYEDTKEIKSSTVNIIPQYEIYYDKRSKEALLRLVGRVSPTYTLKEEEIDSIAQNIITRLNYKGILDERTVSNFSIPELSSINYSYIYLLNDVWDKRRDIELELDSYGLVRELRIIDSEDNIDLNFMDISETINLIENKADVKGIQKIININGDLEYIINIDFKGTDFIVVIDGTTGKFKSSQIDKGVQK